MDIHKNVRLTVYSREQLARMAVRGGSPECASASSSSVSRKWIILPALNRLNFYSFLAGNVLTLKV